jgi:cytochrome P450
MTSLDLNVADLDIASQELYEVGVPHERFRLLREHDPVHWHPWPWSGGGFWALTKHADVVTVSKDPETFSSGEGHIYLWELEPDALEARRSLIETDPPAHSRLRRIVSSAFTPRKVRDYERFTREIAGGLIDRAMQEGELDWVDGVAAPLPINVLVSILGVPDEDAPLMVELSNHLAEGTSDIPLDPDAYGNTTPLRLLPFNSPASWALFEYGRRIGEERRKKPADDLVSRLVHAEVDGDSLTDAEYTNFFQLMVFAGNETTRTAISQGMLALMEHPDQFERLFETPEIIPAAVDELIRWATPVLYFRRTVMRDTELRGVPIRKGDKVVMWYVSANYDEEVFDEPYRLDLSRSPNDHVSFGSGGPHYCLGAFLARLEIRVLLEEIVRRGVRFELAGPPKRLRSNFVNGVESMPVRAIRG